MPVIKKVNQKPIQKPIVNKVSHKSKRIKALTYVLVSWLAIILIGFFAFKGGDNPNNKNTLDGSITNGKGVVVNNKYSIEIPPLLLERNDLNTDASLAYGSDYKELYVVVIEDNKKEIYDALIENYLENKYSYDLEGYSKLVVDEFEENITFYKRSSFEELTLNGLKAKRVEIEGKVEGVEVYYNFVFVEGVRDYYQVLTWTLLEKKNKNKEEMIKLSRSFKEL